MAYKFQHVPVKDVVIGETLSVKQISEQLSQVRVIRLVIKSQRATEVHVRGEFRYRQK